MQQAGGGQQQVDGPNVSDRRSTLRPPAERNYVSQRWKCKSDGTECTPPRKRTYILHNPNKLLPNISKSGLIRQLHLHQLAPTKGSANQTDDGSPAEDACVRGYTLSLVLAIQQAVSLAGLLPKGDTLSPPPRCNLAVVYNTAIKKTPVYPFCTK